MKALDFQIHAEKMFPLVPHLGMKVEKFDGQECILSGPWAPNKNHIGTVFGGSIYCFTALSCYALIYAVLSENNKVVDDIVISEGKISYMAPVAGDFKVVCRSPGEKEVEKFLSFLEKKGKGRLELKAQVLFDGKVCAEFSGSYVAFWKAVAT